MKPNLRALVSVDVSSLWRSCKEIYGPDYRIDFKAVQKLIAGRTGFSTHTRWVAYAAKTFRSQNFVTNLEKLGYLVKTRRVDQRKNWTQGWEVGLAIDAMDWINDFDRFYLANGDNDFDPLLEKLRQKDKRVEVITFRRSTPHQLYQLTDHITFLSDHEVFKDVYKSKQ